MIGSKLLTLFKAMNLAEMKRFKKVLQSPFFTGNKNLLPLYEYIRKYYPDFDSPKLAKELVFQKLFPGESYNAYKMRTTMKECSAAIEEYFVHIEVRRTSFNREKILLKALGNRNIMTPFKRKTQSLLAELDALPYRDLEYYFERAQLDFDYYFHPLTQEFSLDDATIVRLMESIDAQYLLAKLRIGSELKSRERTMAKQYEIKFLNEMLSDTQLASNPAYDLYELLFDLYQNERQKDVFGQLKISLSKNIKQLRRIDQSLLMTQLINYTIRQLNIGHSEFYKEALDLYKLALENDLVLENQKVKPAVFNNIVVMACYTEEFNWARTFMDRYKDYLDISSREDVISHSRGLLYFYQNDFENAYNQFSNIAFSHEWQPSARANAIRTLYELFLLDDSFYELILSQLEAFEKFLRRSEVLSEYHKESHLNFIMLVKKLIVGVFQYKDRRKLKYFLLTQIDTKSKIVLKDWILKKVNELAE